VANHASAVKRHRQSRKRRTANQSAKARVRTLGRKVEAAVASGDAEQATRELHLAAQALAKSGSKGLIHSRAASRRISRLAKKVGRLPRA
jgi:small subunit ribosomal protein S20